MLSVLPAGIRVPSSRRYSRGRRRDQINSQTFFPTERGKGEGEERKEKKGVKREEYTDYKTLGWRANEGVRVFSFPLFLCERETRARSLAEHRSFVACLCRDLYIYYTAHGVILISGELSFFYKSRCPPSLIFLLIKNGSTDLSMI